MTLNEGIKLAGCPAVITGTSRRELPEFFKSLGFTVGAEIGVQRGLFTEQFCKAGLKMYAIDPWLGYTGGGRTLKGQTIQDEIYTEAKERLEKYGSLVTMVRKKSFDALSDFKDGSLDFIYIDGNHEFDAVASDIYGWAKKVRKGGVISGHDYFNTGIDCSNLRVHVKAVVDAYTQIMRIDNWWLIAHIRQKDRVDKNDKYPSFMWFRQ